MPLAGRVQVQDPQETKPLQGLTAQNSAVDSKGEFPTKSNPADRHLSLYDGRDRVGHVVEHHGRVDAFDRHGNHLGGFKKLKIAISAVNAALPLQVCDTSARRDNSDG